MVQSSSKKTMKWTAFIKDIKEKVGFSPRHPSSSSSYSSPFSVSSTAAAAHFAPDASGLAPTFVDEDRGSIPPVTSEKHESELDFKRFWEGFLSSSSEKEKEMALDVALDIFCGLVKRQADVAQLVGTLVEAHIFSFAIGRAFVVNVEKLRFRNKTKSLNVGDVMNFFSEATKDGISIGSNLLHAVEVLVSETIDKQPLLDSGILCCLVHILHALLNPEEDEQTQFFVSSEESIPIDNIYIEDPVQLRRLEVEGSIVHIMKALASHPSAAPCLTEDNSLQLLFQMVTTGSLVVFSRFKQGLVPLHTIQLNRHAMQILGLLLVNNNGSIAKYLRKHHLIRVLLMAVKNFNPEVNESTYTIGIVDLLLECVELSYGPEAGSVILREDIHNSHGYQFLVQFALKLSKLQKNQVIHPAHSNSPSEENSCSGDSSPSHNVEHRVTSGNGDVSPAQVSPSISRLLDILVNLAQTGPMELTEFAGGKSSKLTAGENGNSKIQDLDAIQMLQDIFLKSDCAEMQAEVLNRIFRIFLNHLDNYKLCQQLRTVPLFVINMPDFPSSVQEMILKILEYAVTVLNCVPEQELLSLCCLLQQPISSDLKHSILSFFAKLLSFDQQYKKVLWEVGLLDVLLDDIEQHKFISAPDHQNRNPGDFERKSSSRSFKKQLDGTDAILSSPRLGGSGLAKSHIFEDKGTISVAWDCLLSLLKKSEANQSSFRSANGFNIVLPFLVSDTHRSGVLRMLSCLVIEDIMQVHPEELGTLIEILNSGMVASVSGLQYKFLSDAKCDILGALWRILGVNDSTRRVFGESTGFSLLLTTLHSFHSDGELVGQSLMNHVKVFSFLMRVMTVAVCSNAINRLRLHTIISSQTFCDLLFESSLICVDWEEQVIQLFLDLALEIILPPSNLLQGGGALTSGIPEPHSASSLSNASLGTLRLDRERVYNASAVAVLIRSLLLFTPKIQLELLCFIEKLASAGSFNQENLTSIGCVGLLLDKIGPFLKGSSPLLIQALRIVEVLGSYKLSTLELRVLVRYILQMKSLNSGHYLVDMMEKLILMEDTVSENVSLAPFVEMDMRKIGHASIQVSLGERAWPPASGYTFVCWFQYNNPFNNPTKEYKQQSGDNSIGKSKDNRPRTGEHVLHLFSIGAVDDNNLFYTELYLQGGALTLTTSNSFSLSFSGLELEEGRWHHLAVVHSKPNALAGLFQTNVACVYVNGKLTNTGKLGYSPSPAGKSLQVTIGTPPSQSKVSQLSWRLRCCYLFDEVLTSGSICFMYILGRGYRGVFQDANLLQFVPNQACGGGSMAILDSLDAEPSLVSNMQILDNSSKQGNDKQDGSGVVWDIDRLANLSMQLNGKKLIFAFDGTSSEVFRPSGIPSLLNLVDPISAAASSTGGIPRFGHLHGDSYICRQYVIGDNIRAVGGMTVVLALVEAAETRDMLHMALTLLASALHQNPQNVFDMQACRGYHLLALFLHHRMPLFDMQSLDIFFQIAACEASFLEPLKFQGDKPIASPRTLGTSFEAASEKIMSVESQRDLDDFSVQKDSFNHLSEIGSTSSSTESSNCIVLSNADMIEHVLLDWSLWVTAPVSIQLALLGFLEQVVSMHWYRKHNLTLLRQINLVQHLLVTLQRGDLEVHVIEKLVVLLGVILEDGFLASELDAVVRFVVMTFDPPEPRRQQQIVRETMGKHVIVRNLLLEMLIDLRLTIVSEEMLDQWHNILSLKFITFFLDEYVHPTSMRWTMTLLGVCLTCSPAFSSEFRSSGGYQILTRVLPSFYDSPEIYYILFCLIFGKDVYPRLPEVSMADFHTLMSSDGCYGELNSAELLDSVIAMAKSTFERMSTQSVAVHKYDSVSDEDPSLVEKLAEEMIDDGGDAQDETLKHMTSAWLMSGHAAAPAVATSVLRFMVDLAKMCPSFSAICRRAEFLESCVDLYFSCIRADCLMKMAKEYTTRESEKKSSKDVVDNHDIQHTPSSFPQVQEQSTEITNNTESFHQGLKGASSVGMPGQQNFPLDDNSETEKSQSNFESDKSLEEDALASHSFNPKGIEQGSVVASSINKSISHESSGKPDPTHSIISSNSIPSPDLHSLSKKSTPMNIKVSSSPVLALASWLGSRGGSNNEAKVRLIARQIKPFMGSSVSEMNASSEPSEETQGSSATDTPFPIYPKLLVEIDKSGHGGNPCLAGATAVLDLNAIVLADIVLEQFKASQYVESILDAVPLYVDADSTLVFKGTCLSRLLNFLERRLLRDDEENEKKLDQSNWSANLGALCWVIVDHVYMGAFPQPVEVVKTLEFLLSMLHLANKDGCIEKAVPSGKGLLSLTRGSRQLGPYIHALLKSTNRMIMYCFLPSFLVSIGEDDLLSHLGLQTAPRKILLTDLDNSAVDMPLIMQLLFSNKQLVLCPSNLDTDLICCLCVNLIALLRDQRQIVQNLAVDIFKYLLLHRRGTVEELLASKPNQGQNLNVFHGGFDKLLTGNSSFFEWFRRSEETIDIVLEQCASLMWEQYIVGSAKFPGIRIKGLEDRRKREMGQKSQDASKLDLRHHEYINERRSALKLIRDSMSTELRVICQNKYGWVLHAESEWQTHIQQLVHERGIIPVRSSALEPEWKLCPIEGPYRMRKKLERCKLKVEAIQDFLIGGLELKGNKSARKNEENGLFTPESNSESLLNFLSDSVNRNSFNGGDYEDSFFEADEYKGEESMSSQNGWTGDRTSSINEESLNSAQVSVEMSESMNIESDIGSPRLSSSMRIDDIITIEDNSQKILHDNGEYLIRPYLEPLEKIRFRYNCERVVGLDKHDGIFLIGDLCLYVIENFYIDDMGCICEKQNEDELSVIDQALGVKKDVTGSSDSQSKPPSISGAIVEPSIGGRSWLSNGGAWGKKKIHSSGNLPHPWRMWKLDSVSELLKRDYQLRPVAIEIFSVDGCNDLLVFHKKEREEVFKNLVSMNLPRNSMLDDTISGLSKLEINEGSLLFKTTAKSFSKRWQNGEISNFQYLMHLNTLAGRGYSDLTQYPVFPWVLADYESETLDLTNPKTFRKLDKPIGCQTAEGEEEFKNRYEMWDDPDVPKFHYGSHYSSAGTVLFYLLRLPPFSTENQKLQGGQFDRADRLFSSVRDTWLSAIDKGNTSDVKELIPEFFYMPEFMENRFNLDFGEKQSGEKVGDVLLPPWAKGSAREFIQKHREALESDYVSENLHHWIDLIFGYKQRGEAAEEAVNVFYHYTYEGNVDIDSISDPALKASILAQINHFGQTPKQLFLKPHVKCRPSRKIPLHPLPHCGHLLPQEIRKSSSSISQIVSSYDKILIAGKNNLLRPVRYSEYIAWGFPDRSLRFMSYDQGKMLSAHESLHGGHQIQCAGITHDSQILVTGADDGSVAVWRISKDGARGHPLLHLQRGLCGHTAKITCLYVSQPYALVVTGSDDCTVILWDLRGLAFVKQLPEFPAPVSAVHVNDLMGEIVTAAGIHLSVWSVNGDCLAVVDTSQLPSDLILSVTTTLFSDWQDTNWYVTGHKSGAVKVWNMVHCTMQETGGGSKIESGLSCKEPEYRLVLQKVLKSHRNPVTALHISSDLKQLLSGDSAGHLISWTLPDEG